jgi:hypothetical protein
MRQKYRSPRRPAGLYLQYLNRLIEENRWKGTPAKDVADEEYWNIWRRNKPEPRGRTRGESVVEIDAGTIDGITHVLRCRSRLRGDNQLLVISETDDGRNWERETRPLFHPVAGRAAMKNRLSSCSKRAQGGARNKNCCWAARWCRWRHATLPVRRLQAVDIYGICSIGVQLRRGPLW